MHTYHVREVLFTVN